jgi:hypothetical protein
LGEFSPSIAQPGVNITLFGNNFNIGNITVRFGTVLATSIIERTNTEIVITVPNLTRGTDVSITVTNEFGQATSSRKLRIPPNGTLLSLSSFNPTSGIPGATISLFFAASSQPVNPTIWFGQKQAEVISPATPVYGASPTGGGFLAGYSLSVKVPSMTPGQVKIGASNEFGTAFSTNSFTVLSNTYPYYLYGSRSGIGASLI